MDNVLISANYHACGPQCPAADANCTEGRLNGMPQSGTLIIAAYGVTIEANSLLQLLCRSCVWKCEMQRHFLLVHRVHG